MRLGLALAVLALAGCDASEPKSVAFCEAVLRRPFLTERVRVRAVGIFSDHGTVLLHHDCPTLSAQWDEAEAFERDPSHRVLRDAVQALMWDVSAPTSLDPESLEIDITARYHWRDGRPELVVERVHSVRRVPTVYASEFERNFTRCETGPLVGPRSEEWHAACDAAEEWFRAERERVNATKR